MIMLGQYYDDSVSGSKLYYSENPHFPAVYTETQFEVASAFTVGDACRVRIVNFKLNLKRAMNVEN